MRAYRRARAWVRSAPASEVAARLQTLFPSTAPAALASGIAACQRLGCWDGEATIDPAHYEVALDVFQHSALISRRYPYGDMVVAAPDAG
jgi:hypothetical protein